MTVLLRQIDMLEAQLRLLVAHVQTLRLSLTENTPCPHPEDQRQPAGVMGNPSRFLCTACGQWGATVEQKES